MKGTLSVVSTPIGNLEDITLRAIRILSECDAVLCEDTRVTGKLLSHYNIKKPLFRYDAHSTKERVIPILSKLEEGKHLCLVTDAGTPCISDPGFLLIKQIKDELPEVKIESIPGASAVISALSISGIPVSSFEFLGFLPQKNGRNTIFENMKKSDVPVVFYESTHRIKKTLLSLSEKLPENQIVIVKELTKIHEQVLSGKPVDLIEKFDEDERLLRGEFVVIVAPL
jgi:16S rRNA (cytidine1402-2'-O)-methyltransferase